MKTVFAVLFSAVLLTAAEPQAGKAAPAAPATPARQVEIPKGAVEREPGRFFYTDAAGKKWIYVRTPFGISRTDDQAETAAPTTPTTTPDPLAGIKVTESGDTVLFERTSPFGTSKWRKKKSELDEAEKAALRRTQDSSKPADKAGTR